MTNKSENIYKKLENKIFSGDYRVGERIPTENELCKIFSASRTSVRQALERLVVLGLLVKKQGSGTYVNTPNINASRRSFSFIFFQGQDMLGVLNFCKIFEQGNAILAAENRTEKNLAMMRKYLYIMQNNKTDLKKFYFSKILFHLEMAKATANQCNLNIYQMLKVEVLKWNLKPVVLLDSAERIHKELSNIYSAIEEKDASLAEHLAKKHISNFIADVRVSYRK